MDKEIFSYCSKCGICLSDCPQYQANRDERATPRGIIVSLVEHPEILGELKKVCSLYCAHTCVGLARCPMGLEFKGYFEGSAHAHGAFHIG